MVKGQWGLLLAFLFAVLVAIFAVINVDMVTIDYLFGTARWPLVLVILTSAFLGGLVVGGFGVFRTLRMQRQIRRLTKENQHLQSETNGNMRRDNTEETENVILNQETKDNNDKDNKSKD